ncbi:hypothetical protein [Streptomyces sp. M92]|uniref:hypothetical protein n=1 Tax=Streptomyces sp. M92 TaxID=2944250 RepID=UPI0023492A78|nr:hypothetical protein [Streptomyces sp. M92]
MSSRSTERLFGRSRSGRSSGEHVMSGRWSQHRVAHTHCGRLVFPDRCLFVNVPMLNLVEPRPSTLVGKDGAERPSVSQER